MTDTKTYYLNCSVDGVMVDYSEEIVSDHEPSFWECYEIAEEHGCVYFSLVED